MSKPRKPSHRVTPLLLQAAPWSSSFRLARELNIAAEGIEVGPSPADESMAADLALPIEDLNMSVRSLQLPQARGIHTW